MQRERDRDAQPDRARRHAASGKAIAEAGDQERRHPRPHAEQLPAMPDVAQGQEQRAAFPQQGELPRRLRQLIG